MNSDIRLRIFCYLLTLCHYLEDGDDRFTLICLAINSFLHYNSYTLRDVMQLQWICSNSNAYFNYISLGAKYQFTKTTAISLFQS